MLGLHSDPRFVKAISLFNQAEWYPAHDLFEEIWHETNGPERTTIQGILQVAVAELHLENGNTIGATILFGEGLGRLRTLGVPDLGLDLIKLCNCVEERMKLIHENSDLSSSSFPFLSLRP